MTIKWQVLVDLVKNALVQSGRNQYEDVRAHIIYQHGYVVFREIQQEALEQLCAGLPK